MPDITVTLGLNPPLTVTRPLSANDLAKLQSAFTKLLQGPGDPPPTNQQIFNAMVSRWFAETVEFVHAQNRAASADTISKINL